MKTNYLLIMSTLALSTMAIGCSNDDQPETQSGCLNQSWGEQTKTEADAVSTAATTFATNPNMATCESFKAAYIEYIEALENLVPCVLAQNRQAFDAALKDGKAEVENLNCNQDFDN